MNKPAPRKRAGTKAQSDMTPMIDCVFLLIVFFLMNQFKLVEGHLDIFLPKNSGQNASAHAEIVEDLRLSLRASDTHWTLRIGNMVIARYPRELARWALSEDAAERRRFNDIVRQLENDVRNLVAPRLRETRADQKVVIDINGEAPYLFAVQLMNECTALGLANIEIAGPQERLTGVIQRP